MLYTNPPGGGTPPPAASPQTRAGGCHNPPPPTPPQVLAGLPGQRGKLQVKLQVCTVFQRFSRYVVDIPAILTVPLAPARPGWTIAAPHPSRRAATCCAWGEPRESAHHLR